MGLIFNSLFVDIFAILVTIIIGIYIYFQWAYTYWKKKDVPCIQPKFPFGTVENPFTRKEYNGVLLKRYYDQLKPQGHKHMGLYIFARPAYVPLDAEYIKNIMSRDFQYFSDRGMYYNEKDDPVSANLFNIGGQRWKILRHKLAPTFTSGKMKMMLETLIACTDQLIEAIDELNRTGIDIKEVLECFTTDVIGSCAFGLDCNSFKNPDSDFRKYGKEMFDTTKKLQALKGLIVTGNENLARKLGFTLLSPEGIAFFIRTVRDTVEYRERNNYVRKDFMQLLIDLKNSNNNNDDEKNETVLTIEDLAAQTYAFYAAGFESSATTMSFCLYELALNQDIQERVRNEVNQMFEKSQGKITYDGIMQLKYTSQVVDETLRKYPPGGLVPRKCSRDYKVPDTDTIIEKGTLLLIPILALHHDPEFFPEPDKFDPERFSAENKHNILPYTYIPFGQGPRICIGARFGLMQTKVGLATLLKNYRFSLNKRTQIPLKMDPFGFTLTAKGGIWLDIEKLNH